jgi:photosystem II stability/assembly factor-like uncharacterized protein
VRRLIAALVLVAGCLVGASAWAQATAAAAFPFEMTSIKGVCRNCQTAKMLGGIAFADGPDLWALGFMPPGETGEGDYSILHSVDGGRTWRELRRPWQHNSAPTISFANRRDGLISLYDIGAAAPLLQVTHDGGRSWRRVSAPTSSIRQIQYFGEGETTAFGSASYARTAMLHTTSNLEQYWESAVLPAGFWPNVLRFEDNSKGMIGGCLDHHLTVLATTDWGEHWSTARLETPPSTGKLATGCDFVIDRIETSPAGRYWLLARRDNFTPGVSKGFTSVWTSGDHGLSWTQVYRADPDEPPDSFIWFDGPYWFGKDAVLIFKKGPNATNSVISTRDGGATWAEAPLSTGLEGCTRDRLDLVCMAGDERRGFFLARLRPAHVHP